MQTATIKDKHLRLDQSKIEKVKEILRVKTETEAIDKALEFIIIKDTDAIRKKGLLKRILTRRNKLVVKGNVANWVSKARREREKVYAR